MDLVAGLHGLDVDGVRGQPGEAVLVAEPQAAELPGRLALGEYAERDVAEVDCLELPGGGRLVDLRPPSTQSMSPKNGSVNWSGTEESSSTIPATRSACLVANAWVTRPPYDQPTTTYGAAMPSAASVRARSSAAEPADGSGALAGSGGLSPMPARS